MYMLATKPHNTSMVEANFHTEKHSIKEQQRISPNPVSSPSQTSSEVIFGCISERET